MATVDLTPDVLPARGEKVAEGPRKSVDRHASIVILCWNQWPLTRRLLESLSANTDLSRCEVLVVDNGSEDETPAELAKLQWLRVIRNAQNLGFVRGNNIAIAAASPRNDLILLNNDVLIEQPDWLERLQQCAYSDDTIGIVGTRLTLPDGRLLHAGTYILPDTCWGQQIGSLETDLGQYSDSRTVRGIVFACAYIKREVIDAIGGLSEDYRSYFEDTDYCLRAAQRGWQTVCCGSVTLTHDQHGSTGSEAEWRDSVFQKSRTTFRKRWQRTLEQQYESRLLVQSIMNAPTGYAAACRGIIRELENENVRVSYSYLYGPGTPRPEEEPDNSGDHLLNVSRDRGRSDDHDVSIALGQGDAFFRNRGRRYRIGFTMLEVNGFPAEWVRQANEMDEVWTPAEFNRQGLIESGVRKPVHVIPLGVDPDHFHPGIQRIANPRGDFVFLSNFEWGERKYPELLLKVFNQTFRSSEPVMLVCKTINRSPVIRVREQIAGLDLKPFGGRIAFLHNKEIPHYQLATLYRSGDCFISAGRCEGWDLPLLEAMACGLPAIATDWGGHQAFVTDSIAYPLRIRGTIPAISMCPYYDGFEWAEPDAEHLSDLMRHVFEQQREAKKVGERAAAAVAERWTWRHTARAIKARIGQR
ncbi:MAG: glycosyltransferase [Thermoanaerobaculia bacterium]